jgi:probable rRNA maturation factor
VKKKLVNSYKTWNDSFYKIEANIDTDLWCQDLVNSFEKKIYKILKEFPDEVINITAEDKILISIMFSGDKKVMELNSQFRKINKPTNVLSFPSSPKTSANFKKFFLGDIIFSIETIVSEARANNKSTIDHLIHLFIHGLLHLLGYDHKTEDEARIMEDLEICILNKLSIANPYEIKNEN